MKISVNGKAYDYQHNEVKLLDLISWHQVQQPDMVSIQLNGSFLARQDFGTTIINDGDNIEFLYFMGGGQRNYK